MTGSCDTPGHEDRPARLYPCGRRCEACTPGRKERSGVNRNADHEPSPTEGQSR